MPEVALAPEHVAPAVAAAVAWWVSQLSPVQLPPEGLGVPHLEDMSDAIDVMLGGSVPAREVPEVVDEHTLKRAHLRRQLNDPLAYSADARARFAAALTVEITRVFLDPDCWKWPRGVRLDYHPDEALQAALDAAGLVDARFAGGKMATWLTDDARAVKAKAGYRAPFATLWEAP